MKIIVLGNCQATPLAKCLSALSPDIEATNAHSRSVTSLLPDLESNDLVLIQPHLRKFEEDLSPGQRKRVILSPRIHFSAFHPDALHSGGKLSRTPIGRGSATSRLALFGWLNNLSTSQTAALYNAGSYETLGHFNQWERCKRILLEEGEATGFDLAPMFDRWAAQGCFMYLAVHPKGFVIADIARAMIRKLGLRLDDRHDSDLPDVLSGGGHWPVYSEIAERLGLVGSYDFITAEMTKRPRCTLSLEEFVAQSFAIFDETRPKKDDFPQLQKADYRSLLPHASAPKTQASSGNPYSGLPDYRFWRRAVENVPPAEVDPVLRAPFKLSRETKIATAGSCFAQNLSRALTARGFNYLVAEPAPDGLAPEIAHARNFGVFSARYGNLYTARQLLQVFQRAYGEFKPRDKVWQRADGRYVDPFRPQVEPEGYATPREVNQARKIHLVAVRELFESLDVLVFTFGLTEAWRRKADGAVFPSAPGVAGGTMDPELYEFVNFRASEVAEDMHEFLQGLRRVNPTSKVILTVSPQPMIATFEDKHVLVASTYLKAALRVAAEETASAFKDVWYFPSYEMIVGSQSRGAYFASDLRSVTAAGVDHVMRLFVRHATVDGDEAPPPRPEDAEREEETRRAFDIVCDEEANDEALVD